jgi:hypothetical protein
MWASTIHMLLQLTDGVIDDRTGVLDLAWADRIMLMFHAAAAGQIRVIGVQRGAHGAVGRQQGQIVLTNPFGPGSY